MNDFVYDKYYQSLFDRVEDHEQLVKAGWVDEQGWDGGLFVNVLTTPLDRVVSNAKSRKVSVLLYPGCFAPLHEGHISCMEIAKRTVESQTGEEVVAGFFAPDNDDYVQSKINDLRFDAPSRVQIIQAVSEESSWMETDPWGALYVNQSVNFTTTYDRLLAYFNHWLPEYEIKLYLVFGEDNLLFSNVFLTEGYGVCVRRHGSTPEYDLLLPDENSHILFSTEVPPLVSSSIVRGDEILPLPQVSNILGRTFLGKDYIIRNDLKLALDDTFFKEQALALESELYKIFEQSIPEGLVLKTVPVAEQLRKFKINDETISMDVFWKGSYNLEISRLFDILSYQSSFKKHVNRPGTELLDKQLLRIPKGDYVLVDDDIASGQTMVMAETLLNSYGINVKDKAPLILNEEHDLYDVVDARDFIVGSKYGGLTVNTLSGVTRVPYMFPYVNLVTRAKLEAKAALTVSKKLWQLNYELYKGTGIMVQDIKQQQNFTFLGFGDDELVENVCFQHMNLFTN